MNETITDNPGDAVRVTLGSSEYSVMAGTSVEIEALITNPSPPADFFEVSLLGIPPGWIAYSGPPAIWISAGGEEKVVFTVCPPAEGKDVSGYYPGHVQVIRQSKPDKPIQQEVLLSILPGGKIKKGEIELQAATAFQSPGRVGVMVKSVQFSTAPGGSLEIPLTVSNHGLEADAFYLNVEGISLGWVSTSTPVIPLKPGEYREVTLLVQPPLSSSSQAGRYKFRLVVTSQENPDQVVKVDCTLTVAAYMQFSAELEPREAEAGQPVRVNVKNEGNIQQVFHLTCVSQKDQLTFEFLQPVTLPVPASSPEERKSPAENPPGSLRNPPPQNPSSGAVEQAKDFTTLTIPPGQSAAFRFSARPKQRSFFGGQISYPYQASVGIRQKEPLSLPGLVLSRGMVPVWVLPIVLLTCLCLVFSGSFLLLRSGFQTNSATQTSVAGTAIAAGATQTLQASTAKSYGATQTIIANQTAAAIQGQQDSDGDGLTNQREIEIMTNPYNPDTDGDGLMDGEEVLQAGTNPFVTDTDGDGLIDGDEVRLRTNPLNPDSDGDKSRDGDEVRLGTNPLNPDSDNDGLVDGSESTTCPNPLNPDTDQDGIIDGRDLSPCDSNNPVLTATAAASLPTATLAPPPVTLTLPPPATLTPPPPQPSLPKFPGMVLFVSDRDGNPEIYTEDNAGHIKRMTNNPAADTQPAWGPGLQQIVFTSNRDGQNEIYLMNADGSNLVNLTNNPADDQQPAWSIDGKWIAFTSNRQGNYEIYILQLSNFEIRNLTNNPWNDSQPNWVRSTTLDSSGESIVFTSERDGNLEIYRMKTDGTEPVNLTVNPASDQMARGSEDGALLLFTSNRDGNNEIYSMNIDGRAPTNLTNHPANDYGPSWSPNDAWMAFTSNRNGNNEVYLLTKPGMSELYNLTNNPGNDQSADWR